MPSLQLPAWPVLLSGSGEAPGHRSSLQSPRPQLDVVVSRSSHGAWRSQVPRGCLRAAEAAVMLTLSCGESPWSCLGAVASRPWGVLCSAVLLLMGGFQDDRDPGRCGQHYL